ncbi:amphi-Trp domain-containing protein [Halobacteriales archaeon QH_8_67_27]|nr:MAG: amphi-Trp domain-containing protein [Halobacteriales archaeon QH_8_67_27]
MAKELAELDVTRDGAADRLKAVADGLRSGGSFDAHVNNRTVHLSPPDHIGVELGVRETSSLLRGGREAFTIKLDWKTE